MEDLIFDNQKLFEGGEPEGVDNFSSHADTYTTKQIAELLQVGSTTAGRVMREIKSESDTLGISGLVHVQDYKYWLGVRLGKGTARAKINNRGR